MRQLIALFILAAFLAQTFSRTFIVADYYMNTTSFAKNCENRQKPKMHCNGKCQMLKKLKQEDNKDQQNPDRKLENKNEVLSSKSFFPAVTTFSNSCATSYPELGAFFYTNPSFDIFHPPQSGHRLNGDI